MHRSAERCVKCRLGDTYLTDPLQHIDNNKKKIWFGGGPDIDQVRLTRPEPQCVAYTCPVQLQIFPALALASWAWSLMASHSCFSQDSAPKLQITLYSVRPHACHQQSSVAHSILLSASFHTGHRMVQDIRSRFGADVEAAAAGKLSSWQQGYDALALIILGDQFSRYRILYPAKQLRMPTLHICCLQILQTDFTELR